MLESLKKIKRAGKRGETSIELVKELLQASPSQRHKARLRLFGN